MTSAKCYLLTLQQQERVLAYIRSVIMPFTWIVVTYLRTISNPLTAFIALALRLILKPISIFTKARLQESLVVLIYQFHVGSPQKFETFSNFLMIQICIKLLWMRKMR